MLIKCHFTNTLTGYAAIYKCIRYSVGQFLGKRSFILFLYDVSNKIIIVSFCVGTTTISFIFFFDKLPSTTVSFIRSPVLLYLVLVSMLFIKVYNSISCTLFTPFEAFVSVSEFSLFPAALHTELDETAIKHNVKTSQEQLKKYKQIHNGSHYIHNRAFVSHAVIRK